ncbi:MAG: hypothetical protein GKR89_36485 [Candidatus Latescibacteria bacterium]|nr:hypothetical protein [Candidatus Latescibacterota bacterium]
MISLHSRLLQIPLQTSFKHASAQRRTADSVWVEIARGPIKGIGEGCPRSYVTGETSAGALEWIESIRVSLLEQVTGLESLRTWNADHSEEIDANPAAWCAIEIALLDLFAREADQSVEALLGLPETVGNFRYTAVVSDEGGGKLRQTLGRYLHFGFGDFKFKINGEREADLKKFALLQTLAEKAGAKDLRLRIDGNNLWEDAESAGAYLAALPVSLAAIEEPIRARDWAGLSQLSQTLDTPVILDESVCTVADLEHFADLPGTWIANIRVSKMGGIRRSLQVLQRAKELGFAVIVGAQVGETSVLTRAALLVAAQAGENLWAQEGAFGTLLMERDAAEPVLMFGPGGVLAFPLAGQDLKGMGLQAILDSPTGESGQ